MGINYKGSQVQIERAVVVQEEDISEQFSFGIVEKTHNVLD
jgi:hypothetical protein